MSSTLIGIQELHNRLLKLERQNRRLKRVGAAALVVVVSLLVMGQAPRKRTVEADEFILKDNSGNVRARLSMNTAIKPAPMLALYDDEGKLRVLATGDGLVDAGAVSVSDSKGLELGTFMALADHGAMLALNNGKGEQRLLMVPGHLDLSDDDGFKAALGVEENLATPRTGEKHKTSAASLILLGKDKSVIWKAP